MGPIKRPMLEKVRKRNEERSSISGSHPQSVSGLKFQKYDSTASFKSLIPLTDSQFRGRPPSSRGSDHACSNHRQSVSLNHVLGSTLSSVFSPPSFLSQSFSAETSDCDTSGGKLRHWPARPPYCVTHCLQNTLLFF